MNSNSKKIIRVLCVLLVIVLICLFFTRCTNKKQSKMNSDIEVIEGNIGIDNQEIEETDKNIEQEDDVLVIRNNPSDKNVVKKDSQIYLNEDSIYCSKAFEVNNMFPGDYIEEKYGLIISHDEKVLVDFSIKNENESVLFEVLELKVWADDSLIYDGPMHVSKLFSTYVDKGVNEVIYQIQIALPTSAGNRYQNQQAIIGLEWSVSPEYQQYLVPNTGVRGIVTKTKNVMSSPLFAVAIVIVLVILFLLFKERKSNEKQ